MHTEQEPSLFRDKHNSSFKLIFKFLFKIDKIVKNIIFIYNFNGINNYKKAEKNSKKEKNPIFEILESSSIPTIAAI